MAFRLKLIGLFVPLMVTLSSCLRKEYKSLLLHNAYQYVVPVVYDTTLKRQSILIDVPSGDYEKLLTQNISTDRVERVVPVSAVVRTQRGLSLQKTELYLMPSSDTAQQVLYASAGAVPSSLPITLDVLPENFKPILLSPGRRVTYRLVFLSDTLFPSTDTLRLFFQTKMIGE